MREKIWREKETWPLNIELHVNSRQGDTPDDYIYNIILGDEPPLARPVTVNSRFKAPPPPSVIGSSTC